MSLLQTNMIRSKKLNFPELLSHGQVELFEVCIRKHGIAEAQLEVSYFCAF